MQKFDPLLPNQDKTEQIALNVVKKHLNLSKRLLPKPGQRLFELELATGTIREVQIDDEVAVIIPKSHMITGQIQGSTSKIVKRVVRREGCMYWPAVNSEAAKKQFEKLIAQARNKRK